jgi:hypothetical protein
VKQLEFIRNENIGDLLEIFLVSSIVSLLVIRFLLYVTNYPQLATANFHIAHMLWGGFFMMTAIVLLLSYLGKRMKETCAIIGGIGFGTFIDELGKFITKENDYFFEPTLMLIYFIFLLLFFLFRFLEKYRVLTEKEYLMNSLEMFEDVILNDIDQKEQKKLLSFLDKARNKNEDNKLVEGLIDLTEDIVPVKPKKPNVIEKIIYFIDNLFEIIISSKHFHNLLITFLIITTIWGLLRALLVISLLGTNLVSIEEAFNAQNTLMATGEFLTNFISTVMALFGLVYLKINRMNGLTLLKYSLLISILVTQFFVFYREQLSAITTLLINTFLLIGINELISEAKKEKAK